MSPEQHQWLVAVLLMASTGLVVLLASMFYHRQRAPLAHVRHHWHLHLTGGAVLIVTILALFGVVGAVVYYYGGGARATPGLHVTPPHALVAAGAGGPSIGPNLRYLLPPMDTNGQGNSDECGAWTLTAMVYGALIQNGDKPPVLSPHHNHWYVTGGHDRPTTMDEQVATMNRVGVEPFADWPVWGPPDAHDAAVTVALPHIKLTYIADTWPNPGGQATNDAIKGANDHGHLVGILWSVNDEALGARGVPWMDDSGRLVFLHFSVIYTHQGDDLGLYNSWGISWGALTDPGTIVFAGSGVRANVLEAFTVLLAGPAKQWLPAPPPTAVPTARPRATTRPTPAPARTATPRPAPGYWGVYVVTRATNLRAAPHAGSRILRGLPHGTRLRGQGAGSGAYVHASEHGLAGWAPLAAVTRTK